MCTYVHLPPFLVTKKSTTRKSRHVTQQKLAAHDQKDSTVQFIGSDVYWDNGGNNQSFAANLGTIIVLVKFC